MKRDIHPHKLRNSGLCNPHDSKYTDAGPAVEEWSELRDKTENNKHMGRGQRGFCIARFYNDMLISQESVAGGRQTGNYVRHAQRNEIAIVAFDCRTQHRTQC